MKDPLAFGAAVSAGSMVVLAIWKARVPRWIAIFILVVGLSYVLIADPTPLMPDRPAMHPASQPAHA